MKHLKLSLFLFLLQLYEKQLKLHGVSGSLTPAGLSRSLALASKCPSAAQMVTSIKKKTQAASMLDNCYSKTLIDTHSMKTVEIKEVIFFCLVHKIRLIVKILTAFSWLRINGSIMCILGRYKSKHWDYFIDIQISAIKSLYWLLILPISPLMPQFNLWFAYLLHLYPYTHKKVVEILDQQINLFSGPVQFVLLCKMFLGQRCHE